MKKLLLLLLVGVFVFSCSDDCEQDALCTLVKEGYTSKIDGQVTICHYDNDSQSYQTINVDEKSVQSHLDHGDSLGECQSLSDGLVFADGEIVSIDCGYELPFMHIKDNGEQWLYEKP